MAEWIKIASFTTPQDAYIVKGMLESNDIPTVLNNATISSVYPMTDTWAPVELLVPKHDEIRTRQLMKLDGDMA